MIAAGEDTKEQIDRILRSETLHSSDGLRRLLKFLADKSLSGEDDQLKEYTIGIDAFGKPASYDPRHDSTVRIQAGRLRQKLSEYYQTEGKDDPIIVELPKGRYKLNWQPRARIEDEAFHSPSFRDEIVATASGKRRILFAVSACLIAVSAWAVYTTIRLYQERQSTAVFHSQWSPEVATLWAPFVNSERPLVIAISAPLFLDLQGLGIFRDENINHPEDIPKSAAIAAVEKALHIRPPEPIIYYGTQGGANASFRLGRLLAPRKANVSLINSHELSWRQVSESNVIFIGSPRFFSQQLGNMPVKTELFLDPGVGIRNLNPKGQESGTFIDDNNRQTGIAYTLVSHTPGPLGSTDVISFSGRNSIGVAGAVAWFTEPASAKELLARLRKPSGDLPRYYQVLLKVRFQDGFPFETSYVLHRELHTPGS